MRLYVDNEIGTSFFVNLIDKSWEYWVVRIFVGCCKYLL